MKLDTSETMDNNEDDCKSKQKNGDKIDVHN